MLELFQLSKQQREFLENYRETESLFLLREEKKASFSRFLPPLTPTTRSFSKLCIFLFTTSLVPSFVRFTLPPPLFLRNRSRCSRRRFLLRIETYGKIRGSEKGPILLLVLPLLLSIFFLDSFRSIIGLIRWKMRKGVSLFFSLTLQEVKDSFFFLSCLLRWQSVSFSLVFFPPSYVTRCHESSYTSSPLSNKHRISCYTVHVFSINFIVSASFFRNGRRIETLADYCFVNFVLFIRDIYTEFNFLYFSNLLKSRSIYQSLDTPLDFPSQYKRKKIDTLKLSL